MQERARPENFTFLLKGVLPVLLACVAIIDIHHLAYLFQYMTGGVNVVSLPIRVSPGTARVQSAGTEAAAQGIQPGDTILRVNGTKYYGTAALNRAIEHARVGDYLELVLIRAPAGLERTVRVRLVARGRPSSDRWYVLVSLFVLLPLGSQFLGFLAVWKRPWSASAWLILAVAVSFGNLLLLGTENKDGTFLSNFSLAINEPLGATLGAWLLLLAFRFPDVLSYGRRWQWLQWAFAGPLFAAAFLRVAARALNLNDYHAAAVLQPLLPTAESAWQWLAVANVALFFLVMFARFFEASTPDSKRRVQLLFCGTAIAILPMLAIIVAGRESGRGLDSYPIALLLPALLATLVFPVTLVFVVVVPRAPEIGALTRHLFQGTFSQHGLTVLQVATAGIYLLIIADLISLSTAALAYTIGFVAIILLLQRNTVEPLALWADRTLFSKAFAGDQQLERLHEVFTVADDPGLMLRTGENRMSQALGVEQAHIVLNRSSVHDASAEPSQLLAPGSDLSSRISKSKEALLVYFDHPNSWVYELKPAEQSELKRLQTRVVFPVKGKEGLIGIISLGSKRLDIPYTRRELVLLRLAAAQVGLALENSDLVARISADATVRERIKAEKEAMEKASQAKSAFLASMSHELRTPLTAIIGYTEMLMEEAEEDGNESTLADLKKIHFAGKHLLELINSVLDLSKIEAGKMEIYYETFPIADLMENVINVTKPLVQNKNNKLVLQCDPEIGHMESDRTKVRQALFNLISNASKFTERGTITVSVSREWMNGNEYVAFAVADTGIGMTPEQLGKLFQAFSQADKSIASKYGGTGLGLNITKKFCEMLCGTISVESEHGSGTTFTMRLPVGRPQVADIELPPQPIAVADGALVLVIDDDPAVHELVSRSLQKQNMRVISSLDGTQALALAKQHQPQAIILDIVMQRTDGWKVLSQLKSDPEVSAIPVVMVTVLENRNAAFALGAADYLVKPVDKDRLLQVLSTYCSRPHADGRRSYVLVVDDEPANRAILGRTIESCGLEVRTAKEGREALSILSDARPDLILLDLNMPGMNGFDFLDELNKRPSPPPVIVITAKDLTQEERNRLMGSVSQVMERRTQSQEALLAEINQQLAKYSTTLSR